MRVVVGGYVFLESGVLSEQQKSNIRENLTVYPSRTSEYERKDPKPIPLYIEDDEKGTFGIAREFYKAHKKDLNEEVLEVSDGGPMHAIKSLVTFKDEYAEQEKAIEVLIDGFKDMDFGGQILKAGCGTGKCCASDTLVHTADGIREIGEIVPDLDDESRPECGIVVDGFRGAKKTSHVYGKRSAACLKMTTSQGFQVSGTHIDPVLVLSRKGFEWKKLSEVEIGDWAVGRLFDLQGEPREWVKNDVGLSGRMTEEDGYLFGQLTGDGSVCGTQIRFSSGDGESKEWFGRAMEGLGLQWRQSDSRPCDMYALKGNDIRLVFGEMGLSLTTSRHKEIPWSVLRGGKRIAAAFIQGLMDADGFVDGDRGTIDITSASERLLRQLQVLLLGFGVRSGVRLKRGRYNEDTVWHWRLTVYRGDIPRFVDRVGFRLARKMESARLAAKVVSDEPNKNPNVYLIPVQNQMRLEIERLFTSELRRSFKNYTSGRHQPSKTQVLRFIEEAKLGDQPFWAEVVREDLFFDPVVTIEDDGERRVCDLSVPDGRNYLGNGLVVHNTVMALELAVRMGRRTLILVHKEFLMNQWRDRIEEFFPGAKVGIIRQKKCEFRDMDFSIGMLDSLVSRGDKYPEELFRAFGLIVSDELHRTGAESWSSVTPMFNARYRLGVTATPRRKDDAEEVFFQHIGPIAYSFRTRPLVPMLRRVYTDVELRGKMEHSGKIKSAKDLGRSEVISQLTTEPTRIRQLMEDVAQAVKRGRKVFVLSERLEHLKQMAEDLNVLLMRMELPFVPVVDFYTGSWFSGETDEMGTLLVEKVGKGIGARTRPKTRTRTEAEWKKAEKANVIFATTQMVMEGFDIQALDVLVLATPLSDIEQAVGRVRRVCLPREDKCKHFCSWRAGMCPRKPQPIVVDVIDEKVPQAMRKWKSRRRFYKQAGAM